MEGEAREKYLITGAAGQLGYELHRQLSVTEQSLARTRDSLDITRAKRVSHWLQMAKPAAIINCAAYTNVQEARNRFSDCWAANVIGVNNLAGAASQLNIPLIHISTDFVFGLNSRRREPYREQDVLNPIGSYGLSKSCGEHAVLFWAAMRPGWQGIIVRTAGLFERPWRYKSNFPQAIYSQLHCRSQQTVPVVADVRTNITYAPHLARALVWMVKHWRQVRPGVYHITNQGVCTWYDAAKVLASHAHLTNKLHQVTREECAKLRGHDLSIAPVYTCLGQERYQKMGGPTMPPWQSAVEEWFRAKQKQGKDHDPDLMEDMR